jgi:DNA polymerase I-like protein with 3'-5' exonuclease and polymerase domains
MGDTTLSRVFSEGIDFHQANADTWGVERGEAKTLLYAVLYGAGAARVGGGDVERGERLMARLAENAPSLMALKDRAVQHCVDNDGLIYTEFGRMLYYPHVCYENALEGASKLSEDVREGKSAKQYARGLQARAKRQVFNAILQGTSADILKILSVGVSVDGLQALRLAPRITTPITGSTAIVHESGGSVAADVHDESLFYVPVESAARCASELTALFSTPLLSGCPIKGDAKIGDSWAEVH